MLLITTSRSKRWTCKSDSKFAQCHFNIGSSLDWTIQTWYYMRARVGEGAGGSEGGREGGERDYGSLSLVWADIFLFALACQKMRAKLIFAQK